jgi:hypothetical protein
MKEWMIQGLGTPKDLLLLYVMHCICTKTNSWLRMHEKENSDL